MAQTGITPIILHILSNAAWLGGSLWLLGLATSLALLTGCLIVARIMRSFRGPGSHRVREDKPTRAAAE